MTSTILGSENIVSRGKGQFASHPRGPHSEGKRSIEHSNTKLLGKLSEHQQTAPHFPAQFPGDSATQSQKMLDPHRWVFPRYWAFIIYIWLKTIGNKCSLQADRSQKRRQQRVCYSCPAPLLTLSSDNPHPICREENGMEQKARSIEEMPPHGNQRSGGKNVLF